MIPRVGGSWPIPAEYGSHLSDEGDDSLFRRLDAQYPAELSNGLPEERKSISNVGDLGLLSRECKTTFHQEPFHRWFDSFFQQAF